MCKVEWNLYKKVHLKKIIIFLKSALLNWKRGGICSSIQSFHLFIYGGADTKSADVFSWWNIYVKCQTRPHWFPLTSAIFKINKNNFFLQKVQTVDSNRTIPQTDQTDGSCGPMFLYFPTLRFLRSYVKSVPVYRLEELCSSYTSCS